MSVPNDSDIPQKLFATGLYDLKTKTGHDAYTDAVVSTLNARDSRWKHLKKKPGQTQIHGHAEDAALYELPDGSARAVDFIAGAGGPNPGPGWIVDGTVYKHSDAHDPNNHGLSETGHTCPPVPIQYPYPSEPVSVLLFQNRVKRAYNDVGRIFPDPNDSDAYRHFVRYGFSCRNMPEPDAANKHIGELRALLGAGPE